MQVEIDKKQIGAGVSPDLAMTNAPSPGAVALLTGGGDRPYAFGLATALIAQGTPLDLIGSDELDCPAFHAQPGVNFLNLRGDQTPDATLLAKVLRVSLFYVRLIRYAVTAKPKIFHILWNNKFEFFDRTLLMLYYKSLRKKIVLTAHNVNAARRDSRDSQLNRLTLQIQYRLADHIFVHSERMKLELMDEFGVPRSRVTVIPFGINNAVPSTSLTPNEAKQRLGIRPQEKAILFFGNITPYKGLEYLIAAVQRNFGKRDDYRLIVAGRPKDCESYWNAIREKIDMDVKRGKVLLKAEFIPDEETEIYFKAADVLVLPYRHIYQSGVLFLGYSFGLPALVANVGSLEDDIVEGKTGLVFRTEDSEDLARALEAYFASDLYKQLDKRRSEIRKYAVERNGWDTISAVTVRIYNELCQ